jgi:cytochrome c551/c552
MLNTGRRESWRRKLGALGICVLLTTGLPACNLDAENPGVTRDVEQAALNAYPELPSAEETVALAQAGAPMFQRFGCASCHAISDSRSGLLGPPLGGIAARVLERHEYDELESRRWLARHIRDPRLSPSPYKDEPAYRGAHMPTHPRLSDADLKALVEYLWLLP